MKLTRLLPLALLSTMLFLTACALPATTPTIQENSSASNDLVEEAAPAEPTEAPAEEAASAEPTDAPAEENTEASDATSATGETATFVIDPTQSEARFALGEDLRGNRVTVVGVTSAISGEIMIDPATPANTQIGIITIDAASFVTDSDRRNSAIRRFVLNTDSYPTITFAPTSLNAIPDSIAVGETVSFEIRGDLTLKDQTRSQIFKITVTVDSENQISGSTTSAIAYADYGIFVPDVPFVANVDDEIQLEFDFVAVK